jgi:halimadienyl-diphosphate synthase
MYALQGVGDDLAYPCIKWILKTQRSDGGWGYYDVSTLEETAYCLQALLHWDRTVERVDPAQIDTAAAFLSRNIHEEHLPPLWIGKCLYSPRNVVRSAALAAMHSYLAYRG